MFLSERSVLVQGILKDLERRAWYLYCSPEGFYPIAGAMIPWLAAVALIACSVGICLGLFVVPADPQLGEAARIVFIHVPASWVAMLMFLAMAGAAGIGLIFNAQLAAMAAIALAPTGLLFAFFDLWTGSLWDKAISGNWWEWSLSTLSELVLASLYVGFIGFHTAIEDLQRANKAGSWLLLAGVLSVLVNFVAVPSWAAHHQGALPSATGALGLGTFQLASLLAMGLGFIAYGGVAALLRLRCVILEGERQSSWSAPRGASAP